jgi:hypothetical protein
MRALVLLLAITAPASAETRRIALLVANNNGSGERPALRYAEADAVKLGQALVELGDVRSADLALLTGASLSSVNSALAALPQRISRARTTPADRVVLFFYFSGHSDGEALEIGHGRLGFAELRRALSKAGADVRLVIVDSCKSGALLAEKGGTPGPAFQIRMADELTSSGEALLASSAADESALESREIRGSFFTHHLVSGLRGAADSSGDGVVTLAEAYQYAFLHTVSATAGTLPGPQHPAYDYRLSGQGELVLTRISQVTAQLSLPSRFDRILLVRLDRDQVLAELPAGAARRLALPAGEYGVRAWRGDHAFSGRIVLAAGETRTLSAAELSAAPTVLARSKGGEIVYEFPRRPRWHPTLFAAAGVQGGVAVAALGSARIGAATPGLSGGALALSVASARGAGFSETIAIGWLGYRFGFERGRLVGFLGFEAGGGVILQNVDNLPARQSGTSGAALWVGLGVRLSPRWQILVEGEAPLLWTRKDGRDTAITLPAGWVGAQVVL